MSNRNTEILRMREEGARYWQIAQVFNLSSERIRQIIKQDDMTAKRRQICELDLGISFNDEVFKRKEKLIKYLKSNNLFTSFL